MKTRLMLAAAIATAALAGCATSPGYGPSNGGGYSNSGAYSRDCYDCGVVTRIEAVSGGRTTSSATGAVLGGLVGAVAGRQISEHTGGSTGNKNIATAAGAAAGALAGNAIQKNRDGGSYDITVRMDDGRSVTINQSSLGGVRENAYVRVVDGRVVAR